MRLTSKGQVTVPIAVRERYGLRPHTEVEFVDTERGPVLVAVQNEGETRGARLVRHMTGKATSGLTTDEIMALMRGED